VNYGVLSEGITSYADFWVQKPVDELVDELELFGMRKIIGPLLGRGRDGEGDRR
jgi:hypothetical protein